jgi:hypothetical protein
MQFTADPRQLGQAGVQQQFNAHKCETAQKTTTTEVPIQEPAAKASEQ